jgi:hypothetical protein
MSTISQCPRCLQTVAIPEGLDAMILVRCPLCNAEYQLSEAIALSPPELIPVETREKTILSDPTPDAAEEQAEHEQEIAESAENPLDDEMLSLIALHKENTSQKSIIPDDSSLVGGRTQRKPKHLLRLFLAYVFGGLGGLIIGYIALAWIAVWLMGPRFDMPSPPKALKPVLKFVLPDKIWVEKER